MHQDLHPSIASQDQFVGTIAGLVGKTPLQAVSSTSSSMFQHVSLADPGFQGQQQKFNMYSNATPNPLKSTFQRMVLRLSIALLLLFPARLIGQTIFSRFDFNDIPLTMASIGPAGVSADLNATSNGSAAYVSILCQALKGIDLLTNNSSGIYNQPTLGMAFRFRRYETRADFYVRGGMQFYIDGGVLMVAYRTFNAGGNGLINYGPFNTGYTLPNDNNFHVYDFLYTAADGVARITVDGATVWSNDGPNNRALHWIGAGPGIIGTVMDGNCTGPGYLDYAYFYIPDAPLAVDFVDFDVEAVAANNVLTWRTYNASAAHDFVVERSQDGNTFTEIAQVPSNDLPGIQAFGYTDPRPGTGTWFYRVRQNDAQGVMSISDTREVTLMIAPTSEVIVWPNPAADQVTVQVSGADPKGRISLLNSTGSVLLTQPMTEAQATLDLQAQSPGLYFIQYERQGQRFVQKLMIR
jgi:hypothetical protein